MSKIIIINYGIGNLISVQNMLKKAGAEDVMISDNVADIKLADKLILPGVGHFDYGMKQLNQSGLLPVLNQRVIEDRIPILGICLGAQLMTKSSEEGSVPGLAWVDAETVAFDKSKLPSGFKIPNMGWNYVKVVNENTLSKGMTNESRFYFVHSFHMKMSNSNDSWLVSNYGYDFCAAFRTKNIYACQFHPEKSHRFGLNLMQKFVDL